MSKELVISPEILEKFVNSAKKTDQALRLFKEIYDRRMNGYESLGKRFHLNIFKNWKKERENILEMLKLNNQRERKIFLDIYTKEYEEMWPYLNAIQRSWKNEIGQLKIMKDYFDNMTLEQRKFLDEETRFLEGAMNAAQFQPIVEAYFRKVEEFQANVIQKYAKFYSPLEFQNDLVRKVQQGLIKDANLVAYIAIFVGMFVGVDNFTRAIPEKLIDVSKLPSVEDYLSYILIVFILTKLAAPERALNTIKIYSKRTIAAIAAMI
jgi:hypothetical protein